MIFGTALAGGLIQVANVTFLGVTAATQAGEEVAVADFSSPGQVDRFLNNIVLLETPKNGPQVVGVGPDDEWSQGPFLGVEGFREQALAASRGLTALVAGGDWLIGRWMVRPLVSNYGTRPRVVEGFSARSFATGARFSPPGRFDVRKWTFCSHFLPVNSARST